MAGNIDLRFNAHTNLKDAIAQFNALGRTMEQMQRRVARTQQALNERGEFLPLDYQKLQNNIRSVMNAQNDLLRASGQYTTATRTLTAETTKFNEQLARQKVRIRDIWGKDNLRMVRSAMQEQMALNNMMVRQFSRDATGKIQADIIVPNNLHTRAWDNLRQQAGYYNQVLRSISQETVNWGKNTQWAGRQLTVGFSVPISIAAGFMARFALEADESLTRIAKVYGDMEGMHQATNESIKNMAQDTARYVAEQYGIAAEETRSVMAELAATGLEGPELSRMTTEVQRTSLLGEMNSDDSLKLLRTLKEVYGFSSQQLREQVDYFNAIENSTALTMQDITEGLPRISGIMKSTGTSIQEQTELLVAFKSAGIDIAEGANALKSINFKAVAATPTAANNFFRITGVEMQDLIDKTQGQFLPMMMEIANVMAGLENQQQVELIARIFGIHQGSRAITLLQQLAAGSESLLRAQEVGLKDASELARVANGEIETIQESLAVRFKRMTESIRMSMATLGKPVLDIIIPIGEKIADFAKWFADLPEGVQKAMAGLALALAATGPFVMLAGLLGNLVGMGGRMIGFIVNLGATFKILNPEAKAAQLLQQALATDTQRATTAMMQQVTAVQQLTAALVAQQQAYGAGDVVYPDEFINKINKTPGMQFHPYGMAAGPNMFPSKGVDTYPSARNKAIRRGEDKMEWPKTQAEYEAQHIDAVAIKEARLARQREKANYKHAAELTAIRSQWQGISQTIGLAGGAAMGLAAVTGNDVLGTVSMVAMGLGGILPIIGQASEGFAGFLGKASSGSGKLGKTIASDLAFAASMGMKGFGKLLAFMTGPYGMAIAAVGATALYFWDKHKKKVQETIDMYGRLRDTSEAMSEIYNFTPTTPLERDLEAGGPVPDENSIVAQRERIKEMREEQKQFYDDLNAFAKRANDEVKGSANSTTILAKAIAEGQKVLAQSGDPELAKRAAWDLYTVMSGEFMTFEAFSVRVKLDGKSVDDLLSDVDQAGVLAAERLGRILSNQPTTFHSFLGSREWISEEDLAAMETQVHDAMNAITSIMDPETQRDALSKAFGEQGQQLGALYAEALERGYVEEGDSMEDFLARIHEIRSNIIISQRYDHDDTSLFNIPDRELTKLQAFGNALNSYDSDLGNLIARGPQWANVYSGLSSNIEEYVNQREILAKMDQIELARDKGRHDEVARLEAEIAALRGKGEVTREIVGAMENVETVTGNSIGGFGMLATVARDAEQILTGGMKSSAEATGELGDEVKKTAKEMSEMNAIQQRNYDAYRAAADYGQGALVDRYVKQFDAIQKAERDRKEAEWEQDIADIEAKHDRIEKRADERAERDKERMEDRQEAESKALEQQQDAAMKAIDERAKANKEAEKAANKELKKRFELLEKEQDERQEAEIERTEAEFDAQIEAVRGRIEEEERLEELRQKMYENERERISRLRELFSNNIDLNMAINSGDLDEAARIANDMSSKQADWATQDLSAISAEGSQSRKDKMEEEIEQIETRKEAELDRIKTIHEAEDEALKAREEREQEALEKKHARIEEEIAAEKEKQQAIYANLKEALSDRHEAEKKLFDDNLTAARERRATNRNEEVTERETKIARDREMFETGQADAKASFDEMADHWRKMQPRNRAEFQANNALMYEDFVTHSGQIVKVSEGDVTTMTEDMETKYKDTLKELEHEQMWKNFADNIADALLSGAFGFMDWSVGQRKDFVVNGKLPKSFVERGVNDRARAGMAVPRHSGGIIGDSKYDSWTGPGFQGKHQEVPITALKGEGVVNLRGMSLLGESGLAAINSGKIGKAERARNALDSKNPRQGMGGAGVAAAGAVGWIVPMMMRRMAEQMMLSGLEIGATKALDATDVNIRLGEDQRQGLTQEQLNNASAIISTGRRMGATQRDIITALMTAMQESSLRNIGYGDDIYGVRNPDGTLTSSLGLFQQQKWWGTRAERLDPNKSAELFYRALFQVPNREDMPLTLAAQAVQRSAYPNAYAKWESLARVLYGGAQFSNAGIVNFGATNQKRIEELQKKMTEIKDRQNGYFMPATGLITSLFGPRVLSIGSSFHNGMDIANRVGTPIYAAMSGVASNRWSSGGGNVLGINTGDGTEHLYLHLLRSLVDDGETVKRGQKIAIMGNTGSMTTGPHLHFEVRKNGVPTPAENFFSPKPTLRSNVTAGIPGMSLGGLVPGQGRGDRVLRRLEPGEFVMRKAATDGNIDLFKAINNGEVDFTPVSGLAAPTVSAASVDNAVGNRYYVDIDFTGPVNSDVDVKSAVRQTLNSIERRKPQNRRIGN